MCQKSHLPQKLSDNLFFMNKPCGEYMLRLFFLFALVYHFFKKENLYLYIPKKSSLIGRLDFFDCIYNLYESSI